MKKQLFLFLLLGMLLPFQTIHAQQRNCATMPVLDRLIEQDPGLLERMDRIEQFTRRQIEQGVELRADGVIVIPTVVHVVYNTSAQNISNAQIQSQIDVLNEDFRRLNADAANTPSDFLPVAADIEVQFCLATVDPNGQPTSGITRTQTSVSSHGTDNSVKFTNQGGKDAWPAGQYLNIWVCNIGGNILGYAQFPGGNAATDGVVLDYRFTGTTGTATAPFDLGRTATHEVGHWLNLRHIWGDGNCNVDDGVTDTPTAGGPNYTGAPCTYPGPNSCTPRGPNQGDDLPDMFQNYMDYSDDGCMNLFTLGQRDRMRALFAPGGPRASLLSSPGCGAAPPTTEICDNGVDDDGDGLADCDDPDCGLATNCQPATEICDNGIDDDGDGLADCEDPDCSNAAACQTSCPAPTGLASTLVRQRGKNFEHQLSWNAASGAVNYLVEVYDASTNTLVASGTVSGTAAGVTLKAGTYNWQVRTNCNGSQSPFATASFTAGSNGRLGSPQAPLFTAYPNPADNQLIVQFNAPAGPVFDLTAGKVVATGDYIVHLNDLTGRTVRRYVAAAGETTLEIDVSDLGQGLYLLRITDQKGEQQAVQKVAILRK